MDLSLLQMGNPWTCPPLIRSDCEYSVGRVVWSAYSVHLQTTDPAAVCRWQLRCAAEICLTLSSIPANHGRTWRQPAVPVPDRLTRGWIQGTASVDSRQSTPSPAPQSRHLCCCTLQSRARCFILLVILPPQSRPVPRKFFSIASVRPIYSTLFLPRCRCPVIYYPTPIPILRRTVRASR